MGGANLADLFERCADAHPGRDAVAGQQFARTFAQLDQRANRVAHLLCALGTQPGDTVGVALHNRAEFFEVLLGAFKVRAVPVNVNYRYSASELRYLLGDATVTALFHETAIAEELARALDGHEPPPALIAAGEDYETRLQAVPALRSPVTRSGDDRYLLYTGGTTGLPKGVEWRHEDLLHAALGGDRVPAEPGARPGRLLTASPLVHGTAQWLGLTMLLRGGTVLLDPSPGFAAEAVLDLAATRRATYLVIVGDAYAAPLLEALDREPDRWDLTDLLVVASGGASLSPALRRRLLDHLPWAAVVDGYGTSESGGHGQMAVFAGQHVEEGLRFVPDRDTTVFDEDQRRVRPGSGVVGRLARRGHLPLGYRNDPERTAATFPVIDGERWSVPGDLATVDDEGRVLVLGRGSEVINSGGEKVFPEEVEAVLLEHPTVAAAAVVGLADARLGERITALIVARSGRTPLLAELEAHCRERLAGFKVPRTFYLTDQLHRTAADKPDRVWARALAAQRRWPEGSDVSSRPAPS